MASSLPYSIDLVVESGPLRGRAITLTAPQHLLIGRHSICGFVFPVDPAHMRVGRVHAVIQCRPEGATIANIHPVNAVIINDKILGEYAESPLAVGDRILLGGEDGPILYVRQGSAQPAPPVYTPPQPPVVTPPPRAVAVSSGGISPRAEQLLNEFRDNLLSLYDRASECGSGTLPAQEVCQRLEEIVTLRKALADALGIGKPPA